ncbi:STAS domain-containing protein [Streptomyces sp. NPDC126514]|uniref:STAS domain-containing protein n=1 Tax=Streptomyces sp. NPDC126514 TaxID=3155210 RepID=UPI003325B94D
MNYLTVTTHHHSDRTVITVAGEMDAASCPALDEATLVILSGKTLHLEMSQVSFMDCAGLNFLLKLRRRLLTEGGQLNVTGLQRQPASVLRLTKTDTLLTPQRRTGRLTARPRAVFTGSVGS